MEAYYVLIVSVLFLLAIAILIIGVSNDAVNFLNSAIGSKAASFRIIIAIAGAGVLVGAVFSNGMMEPDHGHFRRCNDHKYIVTRFF